jgi:hypothetical protein
MKITHLTDEVLCAYLDGELSAEARVALERQLLSEPGARVRLDRFRESDDRLRRALALPSEAAADPLVQLLTGDSSGNVRPIRTSGPRRFLAPIGLALAATVAGLAIGFGWRDAIDTPATDAASGLVLSGGLHEALDHNPSGQLRAGVTVLFTFRREDGVSCRQFETANIEASADGVVCREAGKRWRVSAWREVPRATGGYRTAGGDESPVEAVVDALDASGPLSPSEEAALIAKGW